MIAYVGTDNLLMLDQARTVDLATGETRYLDGTATVEMTVLDSEGVEVLPETWPLALTYVPGYRGRFMGPLRDGLEWITGREYTLVAVVDAGTDQRRVWRIPLQVIKSTG